jgi:hypothetical protein
MMVANGITGAEGVAIHEDRSGRATRNLRMREAEEIEAFARDEDRVRAVAHHRHLAEAVATATRWQPRVSGAYRAWVAKILIALATRIAPTVRPPRTGSGALAR